MNTDPTAVAYRLHLELSDSDPPIWRQVWVSGATSLDELHRVLVAAMGWSGQEDYVVKGQGRALGTGEERSLATLLLQPGDTLLYNYAPALGWLHKVTLEAIDPSDRSLPHCTAGECSSPPEFCHGVWDYFDLLERLEDSSEPDNDALWQRIGYDFDPEAFDLTATNQRLQSLAL
jgi:hypothetical protein